MPSDLMNISELKVEEPFKSLFKIDEDVLSAIQENMWANGYDKSKPITIWRDRNIVIDGHTRLMAAVNIKMKTILAEERNFKDENSALRYALHHQRSRRHLDDSNILHLVEKLDKMYEMGGDRRSIFATAKLDLDDDRPHESSREVTANLIGTTAEKVSQCRHVLKNCYDKELKAIKDGNESLHSVYKKSLASRRNEEKRLKEQEIRLKKLQELKTSNLASGRSKNSLRKHRMLIKKLDALVLRLLPHIAKLSPDIQKIREIVKLFKSDNNDFTIFCEQPPVRRFLGSLFVNDFLMILNCFGYKFLTPINLNAIKEEKNITVKKKRAVPPHCNISRVHGVGFESNAERRAMNRRMDESVKRHIEEGKI